MAIAFRDEERFLARAIDAVLAQSMRAWELLLVDDGSTDGSPAIADRAAAADPRRVRVLRHPGGVNAGLPASRNLAIAEAAAPLLCFLDADDLWAPEKLERQAVQLQRHPSAVMVCGPSWHEDVDGRLPRVRVDVWRRAPRLVRRGRFPRLMVRGAVRTPAPSDVMYRLDALRAAGGVPAGPNMHEDQRTFVAVGLLGPVLVTDDPLTTYTVRGDSMYGAHRADGMALVRQHQTYEAWVTRFALRAGPYGVAVVVTLFVHRLRRGLARRLSLVMRSMRSSGGSDRSDPSSDPADRTSVGA